MRHCQRDFKGQTPQEYESWRELYLRLHDEREERLRLLTQNISSAHANKPKGSISFYQLRYLTEGRSAVVCMYKSFPRSPSWLKLMLMCLSWQGDRLRWRLWILLQNHHVMFAVGRRSLAPLVVYLRLLLPWLHLPLSLYWLLTFTIKKHLKQCTFRRFRFFLEVADAGIKMINLSNQ